MANTKKLIQAASGAAAGAAALNVEDVFSNYLYTGNDSTQTITNGIDLNGEGGLVWLKTRNDTHSHYLFDTERGAGYYLNSDTSGAQAYNATAWLTAFNSDGFDIGTSVAINDDINDHVSYTWRKAPKFFDCVTYTGTGSAQNISHNLGTTVGTLIVKRTDTTGDWLVQHRSLGGTYYMDLQNTNAAATNTSYWNNTTATSTEFTVGTSSYTNASGGTYVAYLFAHNDGDGEFGPDGDADIIKCGSYTGADSYNKITLGFEPQWLLIKGYSGTYAGSTSWWLVDSQRSGSGGRVIYPNLTAAEQNNDYPSERIYFEADGFSIIDNNSNLNRSSHNYVYIAIRRGQMGIPESGDDVFAMDVHGSAGDSVAPAFRSGWPVDMSVRRNISTSDNWDNGARLTQQKYLMFNASNAQTSESSEMYDFMNGWWDSSASNTNLYGWMWRRANNFFDVVYYKGDGTTARSVKHNLGIAPEMMWVKCATYNYTKGNQGAWQVYHKDVNGGTNPEQYVLGFEAIQPQDDNEVWSDTAPTATDFTIHNAGVVNNSSHYYLAYLFGSVAGVSKVGSYSGDGSSTQNIDCGFSSGARFVLIKAINQNYSWLVFDTERGIVSGNDSLLVLNDNGAQTTSFDSIDPYSSGFTVVQGAYNVNQSGVNYIYYAIA